MKQWHSILQKVLQHGQRRTDRTGVGTVSLFGEALKFDLRKGFPAVTTKQLAFKQMAGELSCFVRGKSNLADFHEVGCTIWDANAAQTSGSSFTPKCEGDLGRIYGAVWRDMGGVDQLAELITGLRTQPYSRRHLVTAWSPAELQQVCLPPCHTHFQCYVSNSSELNLCVYMRSVDLFLGLPFDVASYALLQSLLAKEVSLQAAELTFFLGDAHIYLNHLDAVNTVLRREPGVLPQLELDIDARPLEFRPEQARLLGYWHQGKVRAEMAA